MGHSLMKAGMKVSRCLYVLFDADLIGFRRGDADELSTDGRKVNSRMEILSR